MRPSPSHRQWDPQRAKWCLVPFILFQGLAQRLKPRSIVLVVEVTVIIINMTAHKYDVVHVWALDMYLLYHRSLRAILQVEYYCYYPCFIEMRNRKNFRNNFRTNGKNLILRTKQKMTPRSKYAPSCLYPSNVIILDTLFFLSD